MPGHYEAYQQAISSAPLTKQPEVGFGQGQVDPGLAAAVIQQQQGVSPQQAQQQAQQQFTGPFVPNQQQQTGGGITNINTPLTQSTDTKEEEKQTLADGIKSIYTDPNTGKQGIDTIFRNIYNQIGSPTFTFPSLLTAFKNVKPTVDSFKDPNTLAILEEQFRNNPSFDKKDFYNEYRSMIDEVFDVGLGDMSAEEMFNTQTEKAYEQAQAGELGSDLQIRTNPTGYYTDEKGKVTNTPQTSGQALTMAENLTFADIENSNLGNAEKRRLGAALMEARALAMDRQTTMDATGQMVSKLPPGTPITIPPIPGPGLPTPRPGPIQPPTPTPFPGTGIIGAVTDPRFVGPSFPGVTTAQNYFNQGIADPRFQRFFQIANQFPTTT